MPFTGAGALIAVGLAAAGCSASRSSPSTHLAPSAPVQSVPAAACGDSSRLAPAPLPLETGVYTAGPATLALGEDLAQLRGRRASHPFGSEAIARGCPAVRGHPRLGYSWAPFLGVACGKPNSMACDRIGIGVNANRAAVLVVVRVGGRQVTLSPPSPGSNLWQGYLQGAGPEHGPLRVRPLRGTRLWFGTPELYPHARVTVFLVGGQVASTGDVTVLLHPGFG